jgi:hypothetical protein
MSTLNATNLKNPSSGSNNIVLASDGSVTIASAMNYSSGLRCCALGSLVEGGYLFAKQGGLAWIVACSSREVSRIWSSRGDAVTVAKALMLVVIGLFLQKLICYWVSIARHFGTRLEDCTGLIRS